MKNKNYHPRLEIINHNAVGYVGRCRCCREIQVGIGNIVSHMCEKGFSNLHTALKNIKKDINRSILDLPNGERVLIKTPAEQIIIALSIEEFYLTLSLFEKSELILQAYDLIREN